MVIKKSKVDELSQIFGSNGVYLFNYRGLTVDKMNDLRQRIKALDANMKVIKNRLVIKYFEKEKKEHGRELFQGPLAAAYAGDKFVEVAKALVDYEKEHEVIKIKAGFIENKFADRAKVKALAKLPGRDQLMSQFVGSFAMPLKKMGAALASPLKNMLILMNNLKDKKEKEEKE